jgi:hypothetical protein
MPTRKRPQETTESPVELKKLKLPNVHANAEGGWDGIGHFKFRDEGGALHVRWSVKSGEPKDAAFLDLCNNTDKAGERRELGMLVADIAHQVSIQALHSVPGPNEAMRESNAIKREGALWSHWAVVPPGHMIFPS